MIRSGTALLLCLFLALGCQKNPSSCYGVNLQKPAAVKPEPARAVALKITVYEPRKFLVFVNYDADLKDVVKNGQYAWRNWRLTSDNFPSGETGEKDLELFLIQPNKSTDLACFLDKLLAYGLRPATAIELMAFGRQYRYFLSENPVLATGSYLVDYDRQRYSACLYSEAEKRFADLRHLSNPLPTNLIFAVVPD